MMTRGCLILLTLTLCPLLTGCHGYLAKDEAWLPSREAETAAGDLLQVRDGDVFLKPPHADIETLLQADLVDEEGGVRVTSIRSANSLLQLQDKIIGASLVVGARAVTSPKIHEPSIADLRRFTVAPSCSLEVTVERDGGVMQLATCKLEAAGDLLAIEPDSEHGVGYGYRTCEITDWPRSQWPAHTAAFGEALDRKGRRLFLVLDVAVDSDVGQQGLRPLDVLISFPMDRRDGDTDIAAANIAGSTMEFSPLSGISIAHRNGTVASIRPEPYRDRTKVWIPLIFSWESDGTRTHVGLGPLDVLFHYSSDENFDPRLNAYHSGSRWSLLTTLQSTRTSSPAGHSEFLGAGIIDLARISYAMERLTLQNR